MDRWQCKVKREKITGTWTWSELMFAVVIKSEKSYEYELVKGPQGRSDWVRRSHLLGWGPPATFFVLTTLHHCSVTI